MKKNLKTRKSLRVVLCTVSAVVFAAVLCGAFVLPLTSCNREIGIQNNSYDHIHEVHSGKCVEVKSWKDFDTGVQVRTTDDDVYFFSEGTYILVSGDCPFCDHHK